MLHGVRKSITHNNRKVVQNECKVLTSYQVFLTCHDTLTCLHEPFGFPYYYGPERLHDRFENDEQARIDSGWSNDTYKIVFDKIERENVEVGFSPSSFQLGRKFKISTCHFPFLALCSE